MKLYYSPLSSNSHKVRIAAALLGIKLDLQNLELPKGEQRRPEYLAINPMGKVPVLVDGDFVLPESAAIMIYLAESKPDNTLYPAERRARAEVNRWLFWAANHWAPAIAALAFEKVLKPRFFNGEPDPVQIKRQEDLTQGFSKVLSEHLAKRQWVAGDTLTLADIAIAAAFATANPVVAPHCRLVRAYPGVARVAGQLAAQNVLAVRCQWMETRILWLALPVAVSWTRRYFHISQTPEPENACYCAFPQSASVITAPALAVLLA